MFEVHKMHEKVLDPISREVAHSDQAICTC